MDLKSTVTDALRADVGAPESSLHSYDTSNLMIKVRDTATKVVIPSDSSNEFLEFLRASSPVATFVLRSMECGMLGQMLFLYFFGGLEPDDDKVSADKLRGVLSDEKVVEGCTKILRGLDFTFGELRSAHKMAASWSHRKLSDYVAMYWTQMNQHRGQLKNDVVRKAKSQEYLLASIKGDPAGESLLVRVWLMRELMDRGYDLRKIYTEDHQYEAWGKVDSLLNAQRTHTKDLGIADERVSKVIGVGISAGVDHAFGCLQVALAKCQGNRKSALLLYQYSFNELFAIPGMMDVSFIGVFSELVRRPDVVMKLAQALKDKQYEDLLGIYSAVEEGRRKTDAQIRSSNIDVFTQGIIDFELTHPYCPDMFEIVDGGALRICPWFLDFIKLFNAYVSELTHDKNTKKGCPMLHSKMSHAHGDNTLLMKDYSSLVIESVQQYWETCGY